MFNSFIFVSIFNQIYAALVSTRDILKKKVFWQFTLLNVVCVCVCVCLCVCVRVCVCVCVYEYIFTVYDKIMYN